MRQEDASRRAATGLGKDRFFFDLQSFQDSVRNQGLPDMNGDLYFDSARDFFAGKNITALVVEVPVSGVKGGNDVLDIWATTLVYSEGGSR